MSEDFRYKDQLRGFVDQEWTTFADRFGKESKLEFIKSLTIARGEADELKSQLYRGFDVRYFSEATFRNSRKWQIWL